MSSQQQYMRNVTALCVLVLLSTAGCSAVFSASDGDIVVENEDAVPHTVTITIDRGPSYAQEEVSATIESESTNRFSGVLPRTDTTYAFYLYFSLDGEYVKTTGHQWDQETAATIHQNGTISVADEEGVVEFTPERRNRSAAR